jgi:protein TonB
MAAMVIELAPIPVAPVTPPTAAPPGPEQQEIQPPPPEPEPEPEPELEPPPEIPEVETAAAVIPPEPEPVEEIERPLEETPPEQQEQAPPAVDATPDEIVAAPRNEAGERARVQATVTWQSVLLGHLEQHKRYPRKSRRRRQEAVVYVRVKIDREGNVISHWLERPSRYEPLNKEGLALIKRSQPLPPPPEEVEGESIEFVVPVEFSLRRL